ncbi:MAG: type VI secretion system tip protein VgrG, partial [Deltaproteobacteria bacterium]|nr:type VI secretion system tip protein VgrG [Candidatus Tharpella aukensis]
MGSTQEHREVEVATPLGDDVLLFRSMTVSEELGRLFSFEIELYSEQPQLNLSDMLGQKMTVRLNLPGGGQRYFNGHVSRFSQVGQEDEYTVYQATLQPWLWFLTRTADCRIFQNKTVPDIVKDVFRYYGFSDFEERLTASYREWKYCVQYRETAFNFISRILEQEGIYYFFKHENDKHIMVLADSVSAHDPFPGYEKIAYNPDQESELGVISSLQISKEIGSGTYVLDDYDFTRPKANLQVKSSIIRDHTAAKLEIFDFPGDYQDIGDGEAYAQRRIEEIQVMHEQVEAEANVRGVAAGSLFTLEGKHHDKGRKFMITATRYQLQSDSYTWTPGGGENVFSVFFTAIPSQQPYRSARTTPKPVVQGPQTAVVVGPVGEEIHTDKYGRVKVMFYWDRYSKADESSSCWIRVSQVWVGNKWGGYYLPRIGQEVIVEFLEGDPDCPVITGRLHNNDNMPPYELPANATRSGFKTHSSEGGDPDNFNEIRFEDKIGIEQLYIQAERDQDIRVKNDLKELVGNDFHQIIRQHCLRDISGSNHLRVSGDQNEVIDGTLSLEVGMDRQEKVGMKHALDAGMEIHLKAGMNVVIEAGLSITLKAGGGFIVIGPAGVTISGIPVLINSGGASGSGSGSSPQGPKSPDEPDTSAPTGETSVPEPPEGPPTPQAIAFKSAAVSGSPFVEV